MGNTTEAFQAQHILKELEDDGVEKYAYSTKYKMMDKVGKEGLLTKTLLEDDVFDRREYVDYLDDENKVDSNYN